MTTLHLIPTFALALLVALALAGCGDESDPTGTGEPVAVDDFDAIDFDAAYGGLTTTDEEPAFGDPYLIEDLAREADETYDDALADDPEVLAWQRQGEEPGDPGDPTRPRFTFLRVLWGDLEAMIPADGRVEDGDAVDWSGLMRVDRGVILVRRVVLFERPFDGIVHPRPDRHTVAWFSHTGGHYDGLVVQIIEPPADADGDGLIDEGHEEPNRLHVETMAFGETFPVAGLAELDEVFEVAPEGNAIHFTGFTLSDLDPCPKGFLSGLWHDDPETDDGSGVFRGRWVDLMGITAGHVRGAYGHDEDENRVFFGKYVDRHGHFLGLLAGSWTPAEEPGHGEFRGHWINDTETVEGVLGGRYLHLPERPGGFFQGRWATRCDEEAVAAIDR